MTSQACPKCSSLRTELRPLFTGTYLHCRACDDGKKPLDTFVMDRQTWKLPDNAIGQVVRYKGNPPVSWLGLGIVFKGTQRCPVVGQPLPAYFHTWDQYTSFDELVQRVKAVNGRTGCEFIAVGLDPQGIVSAVHEWKP